MRLEIDDGTVIENPDAEAIEQAIRGLPQRAGGFVILTDDDNRSLTLQAAWNDGGAVVERIEESGSAHERADSSLSIDDVVRMFQMCARGDDAWPGMVRWTAVDAGSSKRGCAPMILLTSLTCGALIAAAAAQRCFIHS